MYVIPICPNVPPCLTRISQNIEKMGIEPGDKATLEYQIQIMLLLHTIMDQEKKVCMPCLIPYSGKFSHGANFVVLQRDWTPRKEEPRNFLSLAGAY